MERNGSPIRNWKNKTKKKTNKILQYVLLNNFKEINKLVDIQ